MIEQAEGCALCTDWTGSHTRDKCEENISKDQRFSNCEVEVGGVKCGRRHHRLLHGANSRFCNYFTMSAVFKNGMMQRAPPTVEETGKASCTDPKMDGGNFQLSRKEQERLNLIKRNMELDAEAKQVRMKYPYIKDSALLVDNRDQVTAMAKKWEERLAKAGQLEAYNAEIEGYVHRGAFKELSEVEMRNGERLIPINVNQLLLGRTSTVRTEAEDPELGDFRACSAYGDKIINQCWNRWKQVGFVSLLPYPEIKHAKRHQNLQVGDVCLVYYDNKVKGTYRLCIVVEAVNSRDDIVRTVKVGFRPRRHCGAGDYVSTPLFELEVAVQRLVLLVKNDETKFAKV